MTNFHHFILIIKFSLFKFMIGGETNCQSIDNKILKMYLKPRIWLIVFEILRKNDICVWCYEICTIYANRFTEIRKYLLLILSHIWMYEIHNVSYCRNRCWSMLFLVFFFKLWLHFLAFAFGTRIKMNNGFLFFFAFVVV